MITFRTCLFDMRLDDVWDPDQRWALLSDTASKHARTDPVVFLYQYYFRPARLLAIHVDESARAQQQEVLEYRFRGRDKPSDGVMCERTDIELALCLSATFIVCDGFRKLGLQNTEIDAMIRRAASASSTAAVFTFPRDGFVGDPATAAPADALRAPHHSPR